MRIRILSQLKTGLGIDKILEALVERVPCPVGKTDTLHLMIFDSFYNSFRGIEAYFKIVNGELKKGKKLNSWLLEKNILPLMKSET